MSLKIINNLLLTKSQGLSLCCCVDTEQETSYEAIPCDLMGRTSKDGVCTRYHQCSYEDRLFISTSDNRCAGQSYSVCESNLLTILRNDRIVTSPAGGDRGIEIRLDNSFASPSVTINWSRSAIVISYGSSTFTYNILFNSTLNDVRSFFLNNTSFDLTINYTNLDNEFHPAIIEPFSETILKGNSSFKLDSTNDLAEGVFRFYYTDGEEDTWNPNDFEDATWSSSNSTFASNIQVALRNLIGIGMDCEEIVVGLPGTREFYSLEFGGTLCGERKNRIRIHCFAYLDGIGPDNAFEVSYPEYVRNNADDNLTLENLFDITGLPLWYYQKDVISAYYFDYYNRDRSLDSTRVDNKYYLVEDSTTDHPLRSTPRRCPFENNSLSNVTDVEFSNYGPAYPQASGGIRCSPQGGATVGPPSTVGFENFDLSSFEGVVGYGQNAVDLNQALFGVAPSERFFNLDSVIVENGECYTIPYDFYLIGKEGRIKDYNYSLGKALHVPASCNFGNDSDCYDEGNYDGVPNNCAIELFMVQFDKDIPWGPFGSYYSGIGTDSHPALSSPYSDADSPAGGPSYLSTIENSREGWEYRPHGFIRTKGTWRETKEIIVSIFVHRPIPFYIGTDQWDDLGYYIEVDAATLNAGFTAGGNGCGIVNITFDTEGRTVGDFVDGLNALKIDGLDQVIFAACAGSTEARNVPASKVINVSSEIFQHWTNTSNGNPDIFSPDDDATNLLSGADIPSVPLSYGDLHGRSEFNYVNESNTFDFDPWSSSSSAFSYIPSFYPDEINLNYTGKTVNKAPPFHKILDEFWAVAGDKNNTDDDLDTNYDEQERTIRSPNMWFTNIMGRERDISEISYVGDEEIPGGITFDTLTVSIGASVTGQFEMVGSGTYASGSTDVPFTITGYVETDRNGDTYSLQDFLDDVNAFSFVHPDPAETGTYNPLIASGTSYPFPVFLDDSTYHDGSFSNPVYGTGTQPTEYNYSTREPFSNFEAKDISNGSTAIFKSWTRDRYGFYDEYWDFVDGRGKGTVEHQYRYLPYPNYCIPPSKNTLTGTVKCFDDEFNLNGFLVGYGCTSPVCKTQWYIKSERCDISSEYGCPNGGDGSSQPHRFNQEGGSSDNTIWYDGLFSVTQPLLYVCERNFHPECTFTFMTKVPLQLEIKQDFQVTTPGGAVRTYEVNDLFHFCGAFGYSFRKQADDGGQGAAGGNQGPEIVANGSNGTFGIAPINLNDVFCQESTFGFPMAALPSNYLAWCQHIDPVNGTKVKFEDIPRDWPAKAYVVTSTTKPFCSTNIFNFRPEVLAADEGVKFFDETERGCKADPLVNCDDPTPAELAADEGVSCVTCYNYGGCPSCLAWDRIGGVKPMYTDGLGSIEFLCALFRPAFNSLTEDDYCDNGRTVDWAVNCRSVCGGCIFTCNNTLEAYPASQTSSFNQTIIDQEAQQCNPSFGPDNPGFTNCLCCNCNGSQCNNSCGSYPECFPGGIYDVTLTEFHNKFTEFGESAASQGGGYFSTNLQCRDCMGGGVRNRSGFAQGFDCGSFGDTFCFVYEAREIIIDESEVLDCNVSLGTGPGCAEDGCVGPSTTRDEFTCNDSPGRSYRRDVVRTNCCSESNGNCDEINKTWDETRETIGQGTSSIDGAVLFYGDDCNFGSASITLTDSVRGSYSQSARSYATCGDGDGVTVSHSLSDVRNFFTTVNFASGFAGLAVTSGIETVDSRFFGQTGCEPTGT